jgi:hypothetical protein
MVPAVQSGVAHLRDVRFGSKADNRPSRIHCSLIQFNAQALTLNLFICFNSINSFGFAV